MRIRLALAFAVVSSASLGCGGEDYHEAAFGVSVVVDPDKANADDTCYPFGKNVPANMEGPVGENVWVDIRAIDDNGRTAYDVIVSSHFWDAEAGESYKTKQLATLRYDEAMFRRKEAISARASDEKDGYEIRITSSTDRATCKY